MRHLPGCTAEESTDMPGPSHTRPDARLKIVAQVIHHEQQDENALMQAFPD